MLIHYIKSLYTSKKKVHRRYLPVHDELREVAEDTIEETLQAASEYTAANIGLPFSRPHQTSF